MPNNQAPGTARTLYAYTKHCYVRIAKAIKAIKAIKVMANNQVIRYRSIFCSQVTTHTCILSTVRLRIAKVIKAMAVLLNNQAYRYRSSFCS